MSSSTLVLNLVLVLSLALGGCSAVGRVEEPKYAVAVRAGDYEVRRYPARVVAETRLEGTRKEAENEGFRRLLRYISGGNSGSSKIAMTAPVGQRADGRTIEMTAPVGQRADRGGWLVAFTMPQGETLATLPQPNDPSVVLREVPETRVAVVRFSGCWTDASFREHTEALRRWVAAQHLATTGEPEVNRYDPPWTPWFLRRNEVWLALAAPE